MRTLLVHQGEKPLIGILEDGQLAEVFFPQEGDTAEAVLLGRVERIVPGMKAAFVDIGQEKNGFLPLEEKNTGLSYPKTGDAVIVQIRKEAQGVKGAFLTRDGNSLAFKHAFRVKVNTNVEGENQTYANYRLVLTANIMTGNVVDDTPVNVSNLDGYSHSDYVTYTLARINTEGIRHETKTN